MVISPDFPSSNPALHYILYQSGNGIIMLFIIGMLLSLSVQPGKALLVQYPSVN
jgi:hypothetical protein